MRKFFVSLSFYCFRPGQHIFFKYAWHNHLRCPMVGEVSLETQPFKHTCSWCDKLIVLWKLCDNFTYRKCFDFCQKWTNYQAFEKNIIYEKLEQFSAKVKRTLENTATKYIDKTIESMPKRMLMVIKSKGKRIKY